MIYNLIKTVILAGLLGGIGNGNESLEGWSFISKKIELLMPFIKQVEFFPYY